LPWPGTKATILPWDGTSPLDQVQGRLLFPCHGKRSSAGAAMTGKRHPLAPR